MSHSKADNRREEFEYEKQQVMSYLHPPRLADMFAGSPSLPGTPVHSIQTMRRKAAGHIGPLTKILVANRGVCWAMLLDLPATYEVMQEIAIRVFRTAHELAMHTVAIFSYEDRMSAHRQKVRLCDGSSINRLG